MHTKILYTANDQHVDWGRVLRWADGVAFLAVLLAGGGVCWWAISSGDARLVDFVRLTAWGMGMALGVLILIVSLSTFGQWGWLGVLPLILLGGYWFTGAWGEMVVRFLVEVLSQGGGLVLKLGLYGLGVLVGLGLLARLIEKVGVRGFLATLVLALGLAFWFIQ
ncbi:MAG: hypothetical protein Fur0022_45110 [Anaerolineales bacterium]